MSHLRANWKTYALLAAGAVGAYYGGPAGQAAVQKYLPKLAAALGLA